MHSDVITFYNRLPGDSGDTWYPTVLYGCNLITDLAAIASKYGTDSNNTAILNVPYKAVLGIPVIEGKLYRPPKTWTNGRAHDSTITFKDGQLCDFFITGIHADNDLTPVSDDAYPDGFYQYMRETFDGVYAVTGSTQLTVIPHFEVTGK